MWRGPAWLTVLRDVVCLALGGWGVWHEAVQDKPEVLILTFFGGLMVAPGLFAAHWLAQSGIGAPSSPPPAPSSQQPPPSLPSTDSLG